MKRNLVCLAAAFFLMVAFFIGGCSNAPKAVAPAVTGGNSLVVRMLDVGQGDAILIQQGGETVLVDSGDIATREQLVAQLKKYGVVKIDKLIATHGHADHIGGMKEILSDFHVGKVWDSGFNHGSSIQKNFYLTIKKNNIPFGRPKRGYSEKFSGAEIEVLAPREEFIRGTASDTNNNSLVFILRYGKVAFLMTGDMETAERNSISPLPQAAILKAAHHGSRNGTTLAMLQDVSPRLVILSYAHDNSYGFPHKEVVRALKKSGTGRMDTADGSIVIETDGKSFSYPQDRLVDNR